MPSLNSTIETNNDSDQADDEPHPEPEFDFEVGSQVCDDDLQLDPDPVVSNIKHFDASQFEHEVAIAPLYEGASVTVLEAVAQHLLWFTDHPGTSKQTYYICNIIQFYPRGIYFQIHTMCFSYCYNYGEFMAHEFAMNAFFMACRKFMHMKISFMAFSWAFKTP